MHPPCFTRHPYGHKIAETQKSPHEEHNFFPHFFLLKQVLSDRELAILKKTNTSVG